MFGPVVKIVSVTVVVTAPAVIDGGLNTQLAPGSPLVNSGKSEQAKLTVEPNVPPPTGAAENVKLAVCPAITVAVALPVSVQVKSDTIPVTVSVSVGVAWVSVPSVPWIVKLNVPAVVLPSVTVNSAPPAVGVTAAGVIKHVPGAPAVHVSATLPSYPSSAVSVPVHVTFSFTTVVFGVAVTAIVKSGTSFVTVKLNDCVLAAGAPVVIAEIVTKVGPPTGVPAAVFTVSVTVTGAEDVGLTELDGENTQAAPVGSPAGQLSVTVPAKLPEAVTWNVLAADVSPCPTLTAFGLGAVKSKSTTCSVTVVSCVMLYGSVPTACALKL